MNETIRATRPEPQPPPHVRAEVEIARLPIPKWAIGLTVTLIISLIGPLTMAALNPARDLAPRIFSALAGWGSVPFSTNGSGWLTVYVNAPLVGGLLGGGIYRGFFRAGCRS